MRRIEFGYEVLRNGVVLTKLKALNASIRMESTAEIKTAFTGTFKNNDKVNFLSDYIRPYIVINSARSNLGVFLATTPKEQMESGTTLVSIEAYDKGIILKQNGLLKPLHLSKGTKYTDAIRTLLAQNGMLEVICDNSPLTLQTDREDWEIGTSHLTIINDLLREINYNTIWFNRDGIPVVARKKDLKTVNITYRADETSIIKDACTKELDSYEGYNTWIAKVDNPDYDEPLIATASNEDPISPLSVPSRGRRILAPVVSLDNIASQSALQDYVDNIRNQNMDAVEVAGFETALNPKHGVNDQLLLLHPNLKGIYQETSWEMALDGNDSMMHKAKKVGNV